MCFFSFYSFLALEEKRKWACLGKVGLRSPTTSEQASSLELWGLLGDKVHHTFGSWRFHDACFFLAVLLSSALSSRVLSGFGMAVWAKKGKEASSFLFCWVCLLQEWLKSSLSLQLAVLTNDLSGSKFFCMLLNWGLEIEALLEEAPSVGEGCLTLIWDKIPQPEMCSLEMQWLAFWSRVKSLLKT